MFWRGLRTLLSCLKVVVHDKAELAACLMLLLNVDLSSDWRNKKIWSQFEPGKGDVVTTSLKTGKKKPA